MSLNAKQILGADDRPLITVHVPEWATGPKGDDVVLLRAMDGLALFEFQQSLGRDGRLPDDFMTRYVAASVVDAKGSRLFTDGDVAKLHRKSGAALRRLFEAAQKLNLMDAEGSADFPPPSEPTGASDSGSDSPSTVASDTRKQ